MLKPKTAFYLAFVSSVLNFMSALLQTNKQLTVINLCASIISACVAFFFYENYLKKDNKKDV